MNRVLIVDDSLTVRMDLGEVFELGGFACTLCPNIAEARLALDKETFSLLITDVLLPDGNGVDFLKEVKSRWPALPVMLLSSEAEVRDRVRGLQTGADEYVGKPYDQTYMVSRARELIRKPSEGRSASILVIDDSLTFREELKSALHLAGYTVIVCVNGEDGLRAAVDSRPAAVIVDKTLPGIDGATVIRRIRADGLLRHTPCILITASDQHRAELDALDAGADAYVRKEDNTDVILARLSAALRSAGSSQSAVSSSLLGPKKILAVDDSLTYLHEVAAELRSEGYDVVLARSGEEALELLAVQSVDCILLDLVMPGLSGQETCRHIKASPAWRDIPLIMHTALDERAAMIEGINAGADDYITKSGEFEVLRARLRAQLRRKQFEDENRNIREQLLQKELEASEIRAARELAETRERLLAQVEKKNQDLIEAQTQLEEKNLRLQEAYRLKSEFLSNMSHELRTPLNSIIGFSEILIDGKFGALNERQNRFLNNVDQSGRHLLGLINDLLDQSKIEAGRLQVMRQPSSMHSLVSEAIATLQPLADGKSLAMGMESTGESLPLVSADVVRCKQVLYNLLSNAIKFTPPGGRVSVRMALTSDGKRVSTAVSDTGPGIAEDDLGRLFTPFTQLERTRDLRASGTGLGLALSKQLMGLMDGDINVMSVVGRGATFTISLPVHSEVARPVAVITPKAERNSPLALIVDDETSAQELLDLTLREGGYRTIYASTAQEALDLARSKQPQVITLDVFMPGIGGWDLLRILRSDPETSAIPVIMVTISSDRSKAFSLGAVEHLMKPIGGKALLDALARHTFITKVTDRPVKILVVDDDPKQIDLIRASLEPVGFIVASAKTGRDGVTAALNDLPDLVLLDLILPDISGVEVVELLRKNEATQTLPILLVTGHELEAIDLARLNIDVQAILNKGSQSPAMLLGEINRALSLVT